ncbi:unnamed protein product, partial [Musa textilis]
NFSQAFGERDGGVMMDVLPSSQKTWIGVLRVDGIMLDSSHWHFVKRINCC